MGGAVAVVAWATYVVQDRWKESGRQKWTYMLAPDGPGPYIYIDTRFDYPPGTRLRVRALHGPLAKKKRYEWEVDRDDDIQP